MTSVGGASCAVTALRIMVALFGTLLTVTPAIGGVGGAALPTWPVSAKVGDVFTATVFFVNTSTVPNDTENLVLDTVFVTPACAQTGGWLCFGDDNSDPGIFEVLSAVGDASTAPCTNVHFDVSPGMNQTFCGTGVVVPPGTVKLTPSTIITLGAANGPLNDRVCQVNITLRVFRIPTNPAPGPDVTTHPIGSAVLKRANGGDVPPDCGVAAGATEIQIKKGTPGVASFSNARPQNVVPGTPVIDTAILTEAAGAIVPTGSVRFILCQPDEVTAAGCPAGAGTKIGTDKPLLGAAAKSDRAFDTTTLGKYCWRVRYLGDDNYRPLNHTNATTECFRAR